jgi:hypothetical protein
VSAAGLRDVALGVWFFLLLALRERPRVLGGSVLVATLVPLGDAINVYANAGTASPAALAIHGSGIVGFVAFGLWLWGRGDRR